MIVSKIKLSDIEFNRIEPEFYQPKFLKAKEQSGNKLLFEYGVKVIHPAETKRIYSKDGKLRIVFAQNVRDNIMDWTVSQFMDSSKLPIIERNKLETNDVLVTRSGANFGQTSVITYEPSQENLFACADILILKPGIIGGPLLSTFLNSIVGKLLMIRGVYGAGLPHVAPLYISQIPFPEYLLISKNKIEELLLESRRKQSASQTLYLEATHLLEKELFLKDLQFNTQTSFPTKLNNVVNSQRIDSNHFMPKFTQLIEHIKTNFNYSFLGNLTLLNSRGVQPIYILDGDKKVVTSQHITQTHLKFDSLEKTSKSFFIKSTEAQIKYGDILIYSTGAYVGQTNCYLMDEISLASNHVNILRLNTKEIDSAYVALLLNSTVGKLQTEMHIRGSAQAELYPSDIAKFIVPLLDKKIMKEIGDYVRKSFIALKESKILLDQAKTEVESLIENAVIKAS